MSNLDDAEHEGPWLVETGTPGNRRFGALLKDLRERSTLSPQELAERVGVHVSFVRGIERGAQAPSIATARPMLGFVAREQDQVKWMENGPFDLLVRDPKTGRNVAFEFKARVKGQNRRKGPVSVTAGVIAGILQALHDDPTAGNELPSLRFMEALTQLDEQGTEDVRAAGDRRWSAAAALADVIDSAPLITERVARFDGNFADDIKVPDDRRSQWSAGDEARFGRVVRMLAAADGATLHRAESLLRHELKPDSAR